MLKVSSERRPPLAPIRKALAVFRILHKADLAPQIFECVIEAPLIARKARPGNFLLVRVDEKGERIPLTIADSDRERGSITLVVQVVGATTAKISQLREGDGLLDVVGPLGKDREFPPEGKTYCFVSGGLGAAPMYPQTKECFRNGNHAISILGARSKDLLFWTDRIEAASHETYYATDDGSFGRKGYATEILEELIQKGVRIDEVVAIGPVPHMRAVAECCKRHAVPVIVSLNPIMVDGTGMCGGCRVTVGGEAKYACVDGPEFDGAEVDFQELMSRQAAYREMEKEAFHRYLGKTAGKDSTHECALLNPAR